ncbi:MAG: hypothetical protein C0507_13235 [Cyanobacteria bacterium PR.3.49]|nr:hypothetical protein [Cyanobacteria bacterium PR.3.49]
MHKSSDETIPIERSGGSSDLTPLSLGNDFEVSPSDEDGISSGFELPAIADKPTWSSDLAFLNSSGGLDEWKSFAATREISLSATADKLPKLALLDLDGAAVMPLKKETKSDAASDAGFVSSAVMPAKKVADNFENGQTIPTEPPKITDPLPPPPPGLKIALPSPETPIFAIGDPNRTVPPVIGGTPDKRGIGPEDPTEIPIEPPKITDPLPKHPPGHNRVIDTVTPTPTTPRLTGRGGDEPTQTDRKSSAVGEVKKHEEKKFAEPDSLKKASEREKEKEKEQDKDKQKEKDRDALIATEGLRKLLAQRALLAARPLEKKPRDAQLKIGKEVSEPSRDRQPDALVAGSETPALPDVGTADQRNLATTHKSGNLLAASLPLDDSIPQSTRTRQLLAGIGRSLEGSQSDERTASVAYDSTTYTTTPKTYPDRIKARSVEVAAVSETAVEPRKGNLAQAALQQEKEPQAVLRQERADQETVRKVVASPIHFAKADASAIDFSPQRIADRSRILARASTQTEPSAVRVSAADHQATAPLKSENAITTRPIAAFESIAEGQSQVKNKTTILPSLKVYKQLSLARSFSETPQELRIAALPEKTLPAKALTGMHRPVVASSIEVAAAAFRSDAKHSASRAIETSFSKPSAVQIAAHTPIREFTANAHPQTLRAPHTERLTKGVIHSRAEALAMPRADVSKLLLSTPIRRELSTSLHSAASVHRETISPRPTISHLIRESQASPQIASSIPREVSEPRTETSAQKEVTSTNIIDDANEEDSKPLADNRKVRIKYIHIGNRIFLLERKLVEKDTLPDKPDQLPLELAATGAVAAAVIAGKRLRRRRKRDDEVATFDNNEIETTSENTGIQIAENQRFLREAATLVRAASRYKYMLQPGDTLSTLARTLWQDENLAWLIADVNQIDRTWQASECTVILAERQIIDLPLPDEVVDFYRTSKNALHKSQKLITVLTQTSIDEELSGTANYLQKTETFAPDCVQGAGQIGIMADSFCPL